MMFTIGQVFSAITSSYSMCPSSMCRLFDALRQCAARHFPCNAEVRYSVVSGFIFLRFFAPAILGPRLFDLTTEQIVSGHCLYIYYIAIAVYCCCVYFIVSFEITRVTSVLLVVVLLLNYK